MAKTFEETYAMRSRHFQCLGDAGAALADAFAEGDVENRQNIGAAVVRAMTHCLIEKHGWTLTEVAAALIKP
jgi:hypothetical protein